MQVINTNIASLGAQRSIHTAQQASQTAMERLSSGQRINRAADDSAGLAIAESMTSQITGLNQAVRNSNDGISYVQTAEGALDEVSNMLQRMRELKVQYDNGTNNSTQQGYIDKEFGALADEIENVLDNTKFNSHKVLNVAAKTIQAGWEGSDSISVGSGDLKTGNLAEVYALSSAADNTSGAGDTNSAALSNIDAALDEVNSARATLGAQQNRLESNIANLQNISENISASRSRIMDTDFAAESAELARTNVLQQAGMAMLSQANQAPQNILSLLK